MTEFPPGRRQRALRAAAAGAALLWAALATAQVPEPSAAASLRDAFEAAWSRQPEHQAAPQRLQAAQAAATAARRLAPEAPALELSARSDRFNADTGAREHEAGLSLPLWRADERRHAGARAEAEAALVDARLAAARWRVAGEVREAWWAWQRARLDHALGQERLASAQRLQQDVRRRMAAGDLARADDHQALVVEAAARVALTETESALAQAGDRWTELTGWPAPAPDAAPVGEPRPVAEAPDDRHPALREAHARAELLRHEQALAGAQSRAPVELTVSTTRERGGAGERYAATWLVGVRVPLGRAADAPARLATAAAEQAEAEAQLAQARARVQADTRTAATRLAALARAREASALRSRLASELRGFVDRAFALGESDLASRLRAELEATEAARQLARSELDWQAALSAQRQALGLLFD